MTAGAGVGGLAEGREQRRGRRIVHGRGRAAPPRPSRDGGPARLLGGRCWADRAVRAGVECHASHSQRGSPVNCPAAASQSPHGYRSKPPCVPSCRGALPGRPYAYGRASGGHVHGPHVHGIWAAACVMPRVMCVHTSAGQGMCLRAERVWAARWPALHGLSFAWRSWCGWGTGLPASERPGPATLCARLPAAMQLFVLVHAIFVWRLNDLDQVVPRQNAGRCWRCAGAVGRVRACVRVCARGEL